MAEKAIFINKEDFIAFTSANGNLDADKFLQFIWTAQDIHIQNYLGTDLYNKITEDQLNDSLQGDYLTLRDKYISPLLINLGMATYLPFASIRITNGGVFQHSPEGSVAVDSSQLGVLIGQYERFSDNYADKLVKYLCNNTSKFPEYSTNTDNEINPQKPNPTNWLI
jgi:hypothetical protein